MLYLCHLVPSSIENVVQQFGLSLVFVFLQAMGCAIPLGGIGIAGTIEQPKEVREFLGEPEVMPDLSQINPEVMTFSFSSEKMRGFWRSFLPPPKKKRNRKK